MAATATSVLSRTTSDAYAGLQVLIGYLTHNATTTLQAANAMSMAGPTAAGLVLMNLLVRTRAAAGLLAAALNHGASIPEVPWRMPPSWSEANSTAIMV